MKDYKLLINGKLTDGDRLIDVINPATEEVFAQAPVASVEQLNDAVIAARQAGIGWRNLSIEERGAMVIELADSLEKHSEAFAELLTMEQGKTLQQARDEVSFAHQFGRYFGEHVELPVEVVIDNDHQRVEVHRKPLGVVAGICPWNFPLLIAFYKIAPAVVTGNTIIIKAAPTTPLTSLKLGELAKDIFPAGVVNILTDDNDLGPLITSHPNIEKVSFTGSIATGKRIMKSASGTLKRLTLELSGNDAAIVLDDVDIKQTAKHLFDAAFLNSGQVCIAIKRLYVHENIYDELCDEIAALAEESVIGNGLDPATQFGPIQNRMQFDKVCEYLKVAKANGDVISGGEVLDRKGFFVPLTVVKNITEGNRLVDEEPFGPILPIIKFSDIEDVIARANASPYGLGGSIWSNNLELAQEIASRIESGTVWINQHCSFGPQIPFPPRKQSGIGVEWGKEGVLEFTAMQVININKDFTGSVH